MRKTAHPEASILVAGEGCFIERSFCGPFLQAGNPKHPGRADSTRQPFSHTFPASPCVYRPRIKTIGSWLVKFCETSGLIVPEVIPSAEIFLQPEIENDKEVAASHFSDLQLRDSVAAIAPGDGDDNK